MVQFGKTKTRKSTVDIIEAQARHIAPQYAEEMTGILMTRLFNRRNKVHQPINTPKSYINTALKNIRTDIWRRDKRFSGYQDHIGESIIINHLTQWYLMMDHQCMS